MGIERVPEFFEEDRRDIKKAAAAARAIAQLRFIVAKFGKPYSSQSC